MSEKTGSYDNLGPDREVRSEGQGSASKLCPGEIGKRIALVRGHRSQESFARLFGIARNTLINYEKGERLPNTDLVYALYVSENIESVWLLSGRGSKYATPQTEKPSADQAATLGTWVTQFMVTAPERDRLLLQLLIERHFPEYLEWRTGTASPAPNDSGVHEEGV